MLRALWWPFCCWAWPALPPKPHSRRHRKIRVLKLYAFVDDLNKGGSTSTDLRIAILDAFNEAGIAIPFRQTDATPQNMDWLREAVAEYLSGFFNETGSPHTARRVF